METIKVPLEHEPYNIYVGQNILSRLGQLLQLHSSAKQIAIISPKWIFERYGQQITSGLPQDVQVECLFVPDGEGAKSFAQVEHLYTQLLQKKFERNSVIVALGGGVTGDLAGFVAATYLRGVGFVQVPTTLLAQVDASIGGKVGVNHPMGKNLIGAFKQPLFVLSDTHVLRTLSDAEIRCGMGEVIKYGFISNQPLFNYLEAHLNAALQKEPVVLEHLVKESSKEKAQIVAQDLKESNLRMILNFGHTFGHALEAEFQFGQLKHGEAVILGMKCALHYSNRINILDDDAFQRGMALLDRVPVSLDKQKIDNRKLVERMLLDKKVKDGTVRLVLVRGIGQAVIEDASDLMRIGEAYNIILEHD
ncbi:MAG: 3-dehydroquinate synthase [Caldithrix sp.]|nr:3-dehydroquinate synthase [Caldithrix sp.]